MEESKKIKDLKIGLIEPAFHFEVLRTYAIVFSQICAEVHCFLSTPLKNFNKDLEKSNNTHFHFLEEEPNINLKGKMDSCDLCIFITDDKRGSVFYDIECKKMLVVHSFNTIFHPWKNIDYFIRPLKSILKAGISFFRNPKPDIDKFHGFIVGSVQIKEHISSNPANDKYLFQTYPFYVNEFLTEPSNSNEEIKIVIPGSVIQKTRDYHLVVKALKAIPKFENKVKIILAGELNKKGQKIIHQFNEIDNEFISVEYYTRTLSEKLFNKILIEADFLLCPIQEFIVSGFSIERNSYTHISGNTNDIVNKGKPAILPLQYRIDPQLEPMVGRYENLKELSVLLEDWINRRAFLSHYKKAKKVLPLYAVDAVKKKYIENLVELGFSSDW